jgi:hypothetical protein
VTTSFLSGTVLWFFVNGDFSSVNKEKSFYDKSYRYGFAAYTPVSGQNPLATQNSLSEVTVLLYFCQLIEYSYAWKTVGMG